MPTPLLDNRQLGFDTARANLLVNGGFEIWQRGAGPFTVVGYNADRWRINFLGPGDSMSVSKSAAWGNSCAITYTASAGGATFGQDLMPSEFPLQAISALVTTPVSLSIVVYSNAANAVRPYIYDSVNGYRYGAFHTGGSQWQVLTVTAPLAGNSTQNQFGLDFRATCTLNVDNAMLVSGSQPATFAPLTPADDLARCLRYYQRSVAGNNQTLGLGQVGNATTAYFMVPVVAQFAGLWASSLTVPAASNFGVWGPGTVSIALATGPTSYSANIGFSMLSGTVASGLVTGDAAWLVGGSSGGAYIALESNP